MDLLHNRQQCTKPSYKKTNQHRQKCWLDFTTLSRCWRRYISIRLRRID
ncbi:hypothetical protein [Sinobacterium caligoides]|nr:hypothetical protein [Sinobacterium caligoides]